LTCGSITVVLYHVNSLLRLR